MAKPKQVKVLYWLNTGIFPATIMFSVGFTYDEINKILSKKKAFDWKLGISNDKQLIDGGNNFSLSRTVYKKKDDKDECTLFYIIFKDCFKFNDYDYCKLAHEVLHTCQFLLPRILDRDREYECEAYLHTYIMQQCLAILRNKK